MQAVAPADGGVGFEPVKKRKRGPYACATCRSRKIRCDGNQPCAHCAVANSDCVYGSESIVKGKSDAILESVLRLEDQLSHISQQLVGRSLTDSQSAATLSPQTDQKTDQRPSSITGAQQLIRNARDRQCDTLDNAILSSEHTSTTESVLAWPYLDSFPSLRRQFQPIFSIEQRRLGMTTRSAIQLPSLHPGEAFVIVQAFQNVTNFSYPTVLAAQLAEVAEQVQTGYLADSVEWCHALLVMALGCASRIAQSLSADANIASSNLSMDESQITRNQRMARTYFELYLQRLSLVHPEISILATQCLFFTALFFAYLQQPLQAWSYISMTASKCRLLLCYTSADTGADTECLRRIFWSCFILESDYIAELAALPQTGVSDMESLVPFPALYQTCDNDTERELSSLYFLACISMRRLLNRGMVDSSMYFLFSDLAVHDLLYAPNSGVAFDDARFPHVVNELDHQLEEWRECLPAAFQFTVDTGVTDTQHGGFLRQRYLTCRAVIHRPYLEQALSRAAIGQELSTSILEKSEICLDMCVLHILNLRPFCQTILIDVWICALSMASTMVLILAATQAPMLRQRLHGNALAAGRQLSNLIEPWSRLHGDRVSPSVRQSLWMIGEIDALTHRVYDSELNDIC